MDNENVNPGLLKPVDGDEILSPGEIVGGDSIVIISSLPVYENYEEVDVLNNNVIGLVQGISISSSRMIRSIYEIGKVNPVLISSIGQKSLNMSAIVTEDNNLVKALYKCMIFNRAKLKDAGIISDVQEAILSKYDKLEIPEGLMKDLMRIPFGLMLQFYSGDGDLIEEVHLGHCMISSNDNSIEAGTRGIGESDGISWQTTKYTTPVTG